MAKITLFLALRDRQYSMQLNHPDTEVLVIEVKAIFMALFL